MKTLCSAGTIDSFSYVMLRSRDNLLDVTLTEHTDTNTKDTEYHNTFTSPEAATKWIFSEVTRIKGTDINGND